MASNLRPLEGMQGVGAEAHLVEKHLFDERGQRRSYEELSERVGEMQAFLGIFELELRERLNKPRARGYPPRIFISYRRESPEDVAWAMRLADELEGLGYDVLLDERALGEFTGDPLPLAEFMALMADADVALLVLTDGFLFHEQKPNSMRNWIFEELTRLNTLEAWGLLEVVVAHRGGDLEGHMFVTAGARRGYIDLRDDDSLSTPVADFFGPWTGRRIGPADRERLAAGAAEAIKCFGSGENSDGRGAGSALASIADLTWTEEYGVAAAYATAAQGEGEAAATIAIETYNRNPTLPAAFLLGQLLWLMDFDLPAYDIFTSLSESTSLWRHQMRSNMAHTLFDYEHLPAALNQYRWCLKADRSELLGGYWSSFGDEARARCQAQSQQLAGMVGTGGGTQCEHCTAEFPRGWHICAHCGVTRPPGEDCGFCTRQPPAMMDPEETPYCPICRRGEVEGHSGNACIVNREPKGAWSPLAWEEPRADRPSG